MAKNDYFVIVYQILSYLYERLKKGEAIEPEKLMYNSSMLNINDKYWAYIISNMVEQGFIKGIHNAEVANGYYIAEQLSGCQITPAGISYLCDNSFIKKAKQFLKDVKEITPFV